jgi:hypothetical protein
MIGQLAEELPERQLSVASLEAALHRGLDTLLGLGGAHTLGEQIRIPPEVVDRRERDRIHAALDGNPTRCREARYPMSERADEVTESRGR